MKKIDNYEVILEKEKDQEIRIVIADDQNFVRRLLETILKSDKNFKIVGVADNGKTAISQVELLKPDIILIDLEMPEMDGITATEIIVKRFPECKVLMLSSHEDSESLQNSLRAGAKGYLLKNSAAQELTNAVYSISRGYTQLSPGLIEKVLTPEVEIVPSTKQEEEIQLVEEDWSAATRETIETLPRISLRAILYLFLIIVTIAVPWTIFAKVDQIATAEGRLEPKGKTISLDAPVSGTVISIDVAEGEQVVPGQTLIQLESELVNSQLQQQQQKLVAQQNQIAGLNLLKNQQLLALNTQQQESKAQELVRQSLIDQAQQNLDALQASYNIQIAEKYAQLEQAKEAINTRKSARKLAQIRKDTAQEKIARYQEAFQQGIIAKERLLEAQQQEREAQETMIQTASEIAQAEARYREQQNSYGKLKQQINSQIEQAQLRLEEQQRSYKSLGQSNNLAILKSQEAIKNTESQILVNQGNIAASNSLIQSLEFQLQQRTISSPVTGTVFKLPIQKPGAVVQASQMLAQIAPRDAPLIIRGQMISRETGLITTGLPVKLKFDAYPFQDYGVIPGRLTWISPDSRTVTQTTTEAQKQSNFYEIEVELERNYVQSRNRQIFLTPGQTATVEVVIKQRRLIDVFLEPFRSLQKGGLQL
ncbi:response regulator containing a CheY-like receiver domain and an HTH DNA-binding domain [Xenococcus sp. PCC 7305]|uniref:response regulator n=1 Tax=Xenococcus sp. PCC 7305 TaxID=102125 RepID=UPI0002ABF110|nr:response regulator [Xenococcus sp. PCC 7305]ELS05076.1 response regulator containing a CheY-like receiver domain and an HTH DNA-binding domain [Xenococcus sp. PCC 7305]